MAGPASRKNKPSDELSAPPAKRARASDDPTGQDALTVVEPDVQPEPPVAHAAAPPQVPEDDLEPAPTLEVPPYVDDEVIPRLERLHLFREPQYNRYGIGYLPADAAWGEGPNGTYAPYEHLLCLNGKPIVVWMVGIARVVELVADESFSIGLQLLCARDDEAAKYNAYTRCQPTEVPKESATLAFANKWIAKKKRNVEQTFDEVYNAAHNDLRGWDPAQKMDATRINYSDIVLVECYIRRYRSKNNVGRRWTAWRVSFELLRVALVAEGESAFTDPLPESSATV